MSTIMKLTVPYHVAPQLSQFAEGGAAIIRRNRSGRCGIWLRGHYLRQKYSYPREGRVQNDSPSLRLGY